MTEKTIVLTGKAYADLKARLEKEPSVSLSLGTEDDQQTVTVEEAYLNSDPDFAVDSKSYPQIDGETEVQVRIKYNS